MIKPTEEKNKLENYWYKKNLLFMNKEISWLFKKNLHVFIIIDYVAV